MKSGFSLLVSLCMIVIVSNAQFTKSIRLDKNSYEKFVGHLQSAAAEQKLDELGILADSMNYESACEFLEKPLLFINTGVNKKAEENGLTDPAKVGMVMHFLVNYLGNLGSNGWETDFKYGYAIGLYAMFRLGEVYMMPELLYMHRSAKLEYDQYSNSIMQINYLTLHATVLRIFNSGQPRWYIGLGPSGSLVLSGKEELTSNGQTRKFDLDFEDNGLARFNWGMNFRVGLIFRNSMSTYLGYDLSFSKVYNNSKFRMQSGVVGMTIPFTIFE